jgi:hypothetical protein
MHAIGARSHLTLEASIQGRTDRKVEVVSDLIALALPKMIVGIMVELSSRFLSKLRADRRTPDVQSRTCESCSGRARWRSPQ